jgi:hypothetical protein
MKTRRTGKHAKRRARSTPSLRSTAIIVGDDGDDALDGSEIVANGTSERHPVLTGGDVDADSERAETSGEEAVGGSEPTPDQDVVDEIGRALGVEQPDEEEFVPTSEILARRDRFRWHLERDAEDEAAGHPHRRRGAI